jgi:hypothetical protein
MMLSDTELGEGPPAGLRRPRWKRGVFDLLRTTWSASGDGEEFFYFFADNPLKSPDSAK